MLINLCLDLPAIAYTLERGCKYEVKCLNKKTQHAEIEWEEVLEEHVPKVSGLLINQWQYQEKNTMLLVSINDKTISVLLKSKFWKIWIKILKPP